MGEVDGLTVGSWGRAVGAMVSRARAANVCCTCCREGCTVHVVVARILRGE